MKAAVREANTTYTHRQERTHTCTHARTHTHTHTHTLDHALTQLHTQTHMLNYNTVIHTNDQRDTVGGDERLFINTCTAFRSNDVIQSFKCKCNRVEGAFQLSSQQYTKETESKIVTSTCPQSHRQTDTHTHTHTHTHTRTHARTYTHKTYTDTHPSEPASAQYTP